jgi:hypothetical protein
MPPETYRSWPAIISRAAEIVEAVYAETGIRLTLRKLLYKLIGERLVRNSESDYTYLSKVTGIGRKDGSSPDLAQDKQTITTGFFFEDPDAMIEWAIKVHARDRRQGQKYNIILACEKAGTVPFLRLWYQDTQHIPVVALGGESSITTWQAAKRLIDEDDREPRVLYWGDYDADGYAIPKNFRNNLGIDDDQLIHVGLTQEQVEEYNLPKAPGKDDSAKRYKTDFVAETGEHVQVELDALDENVVREITDRVLEDIWDEVAYLKALRREKRDRSEIRQRWDRGGQTNRKGTR